MLNMTRLATIVIGVIGTGSGLFMIRAKDALDTWWQISAVFGGGMLGLFLLGILVPRATRRGAALGVAAGIIAIVWGTFCQELEGPWAFLRFPFHKFLVGAVGTFAILIVGWIESFVAPPRSPTIA